MNKIIVVGNYKWDFYEKALCDGFMKYGASIVPYIIESISLINKIIHFNKLKDINKQFISTIIKEQPYAIFLYRVNELFPSTLQQIKQKSSKTKIMLFHNDNPYIGFKNRLKYHLFLECIKIVDLVYVYRPSNLHNVKQRGVKEPKLLYPHFYSKNDLVDKINFSIKKYDVVFVGHYEKNRAESIDYLLKKGIAVKIFGPLSTWKNVQRMYNWKDGIINAPVFGDKYRETLSQSKLALCFLSKINKDVYTRRNFEIPAAGTLTVSEYTDELINIFRDNEEILLFKNNIELYDKVYSVLNAQEELEEKTLAGYKKVKNSGHSEKNRARQILLDLGWVV
jgi:hypothetical protein